MGRKRKPRERYDAEKTEEIRILWRKIMFAQFALFNHVNKNWPCDAVEYRLKDKAYKSMLRLQSDLDNLLFQMAEGYDLGTTLYDPLTALPEERVQQ